MKNMYIRIVKVDYKGEFIMRTSLQFDRYKRFVGEEMISRIYRMADELAGLHVLHLNTTYEGGGVAEILKVLIPLLEELWMRHLTTLRIVLWICCKVVGWMSCP